MQSVSPSERPTVAGRYALGRILGRGGMGAVYEAVDTRTGERVAVKLMRDGDALLDEARTRATRTARFERECDALTRLSHPNIVRIREAGYDAHTQRHYLVEELLLGQTLRARLDEELTLAPDDARSIARALLEALAAAHSIGIVHRDVKPENVFLAQTHEADGAPLARVVLLDFGIASLRVDDASALTTQESFLGTPAYASPEQARAARNVDARADLWSVGAVLFEMTTGQTPFVGATSQELLARVLTEVPPRARSVVPSITRELDALLARALAPVREERFARAQDFIDALDRCAVFIEQPTVGAEAQNTTLSDRRAPAPLSEAASSAPAAQGSNGRRAVFAAGLAAFISLGLFLAKHRSTPEASPPSQPLAADARTREPVFERVQHASTAARVAPTERANPTNAASPTEHATGPLAALTRAIPHLPSTRTRRPPAVTSPSAPAPRRLGAEISPPPPPRDLPRGTNGALLLDPNEP